MEADSDLDYNDKEFEFDDDLGNNENDVTTETSRTIEKESKVVNYQEAIDQEFPDIARLNVVQVSGDDKFGKVVIVIYGCRLPPSHEINLDHLLGYIVKTMKQFVSMDYSLIYFHYGLTNSNNPGIRFLLKVYKQIDREYKKNLKNLFIVHPSNMLKVIITALLPFFSKKVNQKIVKVERLSDLSAFFYLDQIIIPDTIKNHDSRISVTTSRKPRPFGDGYFTHYSYFNTSLPTAQFGVTLQQIKDVYPDHAVPPVMEQCIAYLRNNCLECEGIFRRSPSKLLIDEVQQKFNMEKCVDLEKYENPHLTACLLKTFLRSLKEPLMTFELYDEIIKIKDMTTEDAILYIRDIVTKSLPIFNYHVLKYLIDFLKEVTKYSDQNMMTVENVAKVFAPNLSWPRNESSITMIHITIKFTFLLLENADVIFVKGDSVREIESTVMSL